MSPARRALRSLALIASLAAPTLAQRPTLGPLVRPFVAVDTSVVAFTHARVIDGTGAAAREGQTVVIRDGRIAAVGSDGAVAIPADALVLDLTGKTLIPGIVGMHEHLFYPTGPGVYANLAESFTRLYLAGGVTSMRTAGNMNGYGDVGIKRAIDAGQRPGPWIDATAPYLEGPGLGLPQVHSLTGPADARRMVDFWADAGFTSFKAYMHVTRAELGAAVQAAHARGLKVTGHLCSVTQREAAGLGIDNLEHGLFPATDFVADKKPDECPANAKVLASLAALDVNGAPLRALFAELVRRRVAYTSTLAIEETLTPGRPMPPGLDVLDPTLKADFEKRYAARGGAGAPVAPWFPKVMAADVAFYRAGGLLLTGTDPTGGGGVIPGFSNHRQFELLVEGGLAPVEAIKVMTLNGATYLGRADRIGSIAAGKQADLVVIRGDPTARPAAMYDVELVFKQGVGYDPAKLVETVRGKVGLF